MFIEESPDLHRELFETFASGRNAGMAAPRGFAKTTIGSTEVIYRIVNNLTHFTLVVSDTYTQARDIVDNVKSELEGNDLLIWVYGDLRTDYHWTSGGFTANNGVRVLARGSNMKVRGLKFRHYRPDFVLCDDLENDEAVANQERRDKLMNWFRFALMRAISAKDAQIVIIGTILHADSLLSNVVKGESGFAGWLRKRWAALQTADDGSYTSLWPGMFAVGILLQMRDDPQYEHYMGPLAFAQEMQNEPVDDASRVIKREWIYGPSDKPYPYSLAEKLQEWRNNNPTASESSTWVTVQLDPIIMAVDPAISEKTTADYFAMFVLGVDKDTGDIYELDVFRDRIGEINDQVQRVLEFNRLWKPDQIRVEAVAYQAGLGKAVQRAALKAGELAPVRQVVPDKDKFRRAVIHSANFAGGLVHLRRDHPLFDALVAEIMEFPKGKHDDMLDAYMHAAEQLVMRLKTRAFTRKPAGL